MKLEWIKLHTEDKQTQKFHNENEILFNLNLALDIHPSTTKLQNV